MTPRRRRKRIFRRKHGANSWVVKLLIPALIVAALLLLPFAFETTATILSMIET